MQFNEGKKMSEQKIESLTKQISALQEHIETIKAESQVLAETCRDLLGSVVSVRTQLILEKKKNESREADLLVLKKQIESFRKEETKK